MGGDLSACRLIFGEADYFPGLTADRFNDIIVTQTLSCGMENLKPVIFPLLYKLLRKDGQEIRGIYERNDVGIRELEGLSQYKGWFPLEGVKEPESCVTFINENGIEYEVDVENGQKTGFFLDQKFNRAAVARIAKGKRVLDCFTNSGSFALNAARGGAEHVCAVDISETAVSAARSNAERNGLSSVMDFKCEDIFGLLSKLDREGGSDYNFIILDPPAFAKSRRTLDSAIRGYKEINYRAMKLLPRGGFLATCSCSHFMTEELFVNMLRSAAADAAVELRQIEARQQSPDHPILWNVPETNYLKFFIFQVV
jgi:23S rRNA (cytosine1962-C5)-methyltransferase